MAMMESEIDLLQVEKRIRNRVKSRWKKIAVITTSMSR